MSTKLKQTSFIILLFAFFSLPFYNIFSVDFVDGHDFILHFRMIYVLETFIKRGIILPRWLPDATYGYGTPVFTFMWGVPYYLGAFLHMTGLNFQQVFKILILAPNVLSGIGFFLWIKSKYGKFVAAVSSIVYIFAPYRFLDSFIRNALGELFFFAFLPFVLLFLDRAKSKKGVITGSFFAALMIYSHQGLSLIGYPLLIAYTLLQYVTRHYTLFVIPNLFRNPFRVNFQGEPIGILKPACAGRQVQDDKIKNQILILTGGLLLTFFYWVPVVAYRSFLSIREGKIQSIWFPPLWSLIRSKWEGGSVFDGKRLIMSFQIGLGQLGIIFLSHLYLLFSVIKSKTRTFYFILFWLCLFWLSIFFMQPVSKWFWVNIPLIINLQFPFRLLFVPMFTAAVLTSLILSQTKKSLRFLLGFLFVTAVIIANRNHLGVQNKELDLKEIATYRGSYDVGGEKLPKYVNLRKIEEDFIKSGVGDEFTIVSGSGKILSQKRKGYLSQAKINMETEGKVKIRRIYFPGWQIYLNDQKTENFEKGNGVFLNLPKGKSIIKAEYKNPQLITFSNSISFISLIVLSILLTTSYF